MNLEDKSSFFQRPLSIEAYEQFQEMQHIFDNIILTEKKKTLRHISGIMGLTHQ